MNRIAFLKVYIKREPADLFSRHALAMELVKQGDDVEARLLMEEILALDEYYLGTYYHLGKLHERQADLNAAKSVYLKGIEIAERLNERNPLRELKAALQQLNDELE